MMNKFNTILQMQLKEKLDLSFLKSKKTTLFKVVFAIVGFVVITMAAYLIFGFCQKQHIFSALNYIPSSVMSIVLSLILLLNLFTCTIGLSKTLFYSKDNQMLVTYPVNPNTLFVSKIIVFFINEVKKAFSFAIPIFFAYGMACGLPAVYYFWMPFIFLFITAMTVLFGALLSIPMNYVLRFLNRFPIFKLILLGVVLGLLIWGVVFLINLIPTNINLIKVWPFVSKAIRTFLNFYTRFMAPIYWLAQCLCGTYSEMEIVFWTVYSWSVPLALIGIIAVLLGLNLLTSRPLYLKLITKEFEFNKKERKSLKINISRHPVWSACLYETKRCLRDTSVVATTIATIIISPIAILLLNRIYAAIDTRIMGDYLSVTFNVLIVLLFSLAHNINVSSIFSRDGEAYYINKTKPAHQFAILLPRLFYNSISSILILIAAGATFFASSTLNAGESVCCFFMFLFATLTHIVWSADFDFLRPQSHIFKTEGTAGSNPNEVKSVIVCFALSAVVTGLTIFLLIDALGHVWLKLMFVMMAAFAIRLALFLLKAKTLFKEI